VPDKSQPPHATSPAERLARIEAIVAAQQREQTRQGDILEKMSDMLGGISTAQRDINKMTDEVKALNTDWNLAMTESTRERRKIWERIHEVEKQLGDRMSKAESDIRDLRTYAKAYIAGIAATAGLLAFIGSFVAQIIGG